VGGEQSLGSAVLRRGDRNAMALSPSSAHRSGFLALTELPRVPFSIGRRFGHNANFPHIFLESVTALSGKAADCQRVFPLEHLLDQHIPGLFQLREMAGKISLSQTAFPLQIQAYIRDHEIASS
jgi:hypothetical protein